MRNPENYYPTQVKLNRFAGELEQYLDKMSKRGVHTHFEVQVFEIPAVNKGNARKSIRRMLGYSGLGCETTKQDFVMLSVQHGNEDS